MTRGVRRRLLKKNPAKLVPAKVGIGRAARFGFNGEQSRGVTIRGRRQRPEQDGLLDYLRDYGSRSC